MMSGFEMVTMKAVSPLWNSVPFFPLTWIFFIGFLVVAVVQVLQDAVLVPKIMGSAMGLNPAVILLSLSIWGSLLGFIGLIIALPLTTLLISYYRQFILEESPESEKVA